MHFRSVLWAAWASPTGASPSRRCARSSRRRLAANGAVRSRHWRQLTIKSIIRKVPLGRTVIDDIFNLDGAERALPRGLFDGVSRKADNARNDEERAAILPRDSH